MPKHKQTWCLTSAETARLIRDGHAEARFNVALRPQKPLGSVGRGAQDGHLDFHTPPELCMPTDPVSIAHFDRPGWRVVVLITVQR